MRLFAAGTGPLERIEQVLLQRIIGRQPGRARRGNQEREEHEYAEQNPWVAQEGGYAHLCRTFGLSTE